METLRICGRLSNVNTSAYGNASHPRQPFRCKYISIWKRFAYAAHSRPPRFIHNYLIIALFTRQTRDDDYATANIQSNGQLIHVLRILLSQHLQMLAACSRTRSRFATRLPLRRSLGRSLGRTLGRTLGHTLGRAPGRTFNSLPGSRSSRPIPLLRLRRGLLPWMLLT